MADAKISALPSATVPLAGTEVLPVVQGGTTDKVTAADLLRQNGQTVTTSNPVLSLAQTWNAGGVTFTGLLFNATDTASASGSLLMNLQVGGVSQFSVTKAGRLDLLGLIAAGGNIVGAANVQVGASFSLLWSGSTVLKAASDGFVRIANNAQSITADLGVEAANTLAQRNGTNAQTFNIYNTYATAGTDYERATHIWAGGLYAIRTQAGGTGSARNIEVYPGTGAILRLGSNNVQSWQINTSGHFLAATDNTYDIGASGATRPRTIYAATSFISGNALVAGSGGSISFLARTSMASPSDGVLTISNNANTDFSRLQFGGTTSSFPALTRSGAGLVAQLADGSARAVFECGALGSNSTITSVGSVTASNATAIPAGGGASTGFKFSSTTNFGVFFGSGAPTLSAAKGSLYLRSDGSGTGDRMYVNTDGSTAWTAVTTAT